MGSLLKQYIERRDVVVPLDQGGNRPKARDRLSVQRPDLVTDARAVVIDAQGTAVGEVPDAVTGQMDFPDEQPAAMPRCRPRHPSHGCGR